MNAQELDAMVAMSSHGQGVLCHTQPKTHSPKGKFMQPLVEVKTLVKGDDVKKMSIEGLVQTIKSLEKEQTELTHISTPSAKLDARKAEIGTTLTLVAAELDSRA